MLELVSAVEGEDGDSLAVEADALGCGGGFDDDAVSQSLDEKDSAGCERFEELVGSTRRSAPSPRR